MSGRSNIITTAFVVPPFGAIGSPPASEKWFEEKKKEILEKLSEMYPDVEFKVYDIKTPEDVSEFLKREATSVGYLIFILNCITGLIRPILYTHKPVLMIAESYGGSGEYLLEYSEARKKGLPVVGVVTRDVTNEEVLKKVKLLITISRLRNSKILFVVTPSEKYLMNVEYPLSIDIYSSLKSVVAITGVTPIIIDGEEFAEKYYKSIKDEEARPIAEKWIKNADKNLEIKSEIFKAAKLYLAMKKAVLDYEADAIAFDCIVLHNIGIVDAWPCLGFLELWFDGIIPICEADPYSGVLLLAGKYLVERHGFITDPAVDELKDEIIYYHCYAPINPLGPDSPTCPYIITPAHLGIKRASVHVKLPVNETITVVGLSPEEKILTIHTAKVVENELSEHACATKVVGKTNVNTISKKWPSRSGWHRVVFYGNWREEFIDLAILLGLEVLEEDGGECL